MKIPVAPKTAHRRQCDVDSYGVYWVREGRDCIRLCARRSCPHPLYRDSAGAGFILDTDTDANPQFPRLVRAIESHVERGEWQHLKPVAVDVAAQEVLW